MKTPENMLDDKPVKIDTETRAVNELPVTGTHTPGPWVPRESNLSRDGDLWFIEVEGTIGLGGRVAETFRAANARLIAAAPDLLAALKQLAEAYEELADMHDVHLATFGLEMSEAYAAIARAEGR